LNKISKIRAFFPIETFRGHEEAMQLAKEKCCFLAEKLGNQSAISVF